MSNESYRNECSNCGFRFSVLAELFILFLTFVGFLFRKHSWNDVIDQAKLVYLVFSVEFYRKILKYKEFGYMRALLIILGLGVLLSPFAIHVFWPDDFNWAVAFLGNILMTIITAVVSILWSSSQQKSEAVRSWLPFAESACDSVYTIEATAKEGFEKTQEVNSPCQLIVDNLKEDATTAIIQLVKQNCRHCQQTLRQIIRIIESTENNWFRFIDANCESGECDQIYARLEQRKKQLGLSEPD